MILVMMGLGDLSLGTAIPPEGEPLAEFSQTSPPQPEPSGTVALPTMGQRWQIMPIIRVVVGLGESTLGDLRHQRGILGEIYSG